ncbi:MAG: N-acetylneuraminate synthase [Clostridia bacterium]|nr:N-acetylneuraminate synthase [Clostridia bacterium]
MKSFDEILKKGTFIIAEAGVNHNGNLRLAIELINAAFAAGADAVKFQTFHADKLVTKSAEKAQYQKEATGSSESQYQMLRRLELTYEDHVKLFSYCKNKGIVFLSTPFDSESVDLLDELGVGIFKISSGDLTNMPMLQYVAAKGKPVILSTGMADIKETEEAVLWMRKAGVKHLALLHCTTNYPTPYPEVNLKAMETMKEAFKIPVGYSDHTVGIEVPLAAAALGACIIEKHFTLDKTMEGPDHKASLNPVELKMMVEGIRNIEKALGNGIKKPTQGELQNLALARKSIVAGRNIPKGHKIGMTDLDIKRPFSGIEPKYIYDVIGKVAKRDIQAEENINWSDIEL